MQRGTFDRTAAASSSSAFDSFKPSKAVAQLPGHLHSSGRTRQLVSEPIADAIHYYIPENIHFTLTLPHH